MGIRIPDSICNIHKLFSDSIRTEKHTAYIGEYVQLYPAYNRHSHQHYHWNGYLDLAKDSGCSNGIYGRVCSQQQQIEDIVWLNDNHINRLLVMALTIRHHEQSIYKHISQIVWERH